MNIHTTQTFANPLQVYLSNQTLQKLLNLLLKATTAEPRGISGEVPFELHREVVVQCCLVMS